MTPDDGRILALVWREGTSIGGAAASLAAYGVALASLVRGYGRASGIACVDGVAAPAPLAFWPLLSGAVILAVVSFTLRPRRKNEHGERSGTDLFAIFVVIAMPLAALATTFGYAVAYACWE